MDENTINMIQRYCESQTQELLRTTQRSVYADMVEYILSSRVITAVLVRVHTERIPISPLQFLMNNLLHIKKKGIYRCSASIEKVVFYYYPAV